MEVSVEKIEVYNRYCKHYDLISKSCYSARKNIEHALSDDFLPYVISALIVFDMQRQMGRGLRAKFDKSAGGFATRLSNTLIKNKDKLISLGDFSMSTINLDEQGKIIQHVYQDLAVSSSLAEQDKDFHVGATKILHFIHPELFPIVDSNSATVLRDEFGIKYARSGQLGYSKDRYILAMKSIQSFVLENATLHELERGTPITRIFDKLAFVQGAEL